MVRDHTDPQIVALPTHEPQAERLPPWAKVTIAVVTLLGGGGSLALSFLRPSVVEALGVETTEEHAKDVERIERRMEAFEVQAEKNTDRIIDEVKRGRGRR